MGVADWEEFCEPPFSRRENGLEKRGKRRRVVSERSESVASRKLAQATGNKK